MKMEQSNNVTIKNHLQFKKAFTLIEILVAVAVFSLIVGAATGLFVSAIHSQRRVLAAQELLDQTSYALEYMGRALRMAKKELNAPTCLSQNGLNYEATINGIKFLDYQNPPNCIEFFLENWQLKKRVGTETSLGLTSPSIRVNQFRVNLAGEAQPPIDNLQPRVTIFLEVFGRRTLGDQRPKIQIQTTISQRNLDVQY